MSKKNITKGYLRMMGKTWKSNSKDQSHIEIQYDLCYVEYADELNGKKPGKSEALKYFEDAGYYCIDNLPTQLILNLIDSFSSSSKKVDKIALAIDLRSGYFFDDIYKTLEKLKELGINYKIFPSLWFGGQLIDGLSGWEV